MNPYFCGLRPLVALCSLFASLSVWAAEDNAALLRQGEYVARAADCAACHRTVEKAARRWPVVMPSTRPWARSLPATSPRPRPTA